MKSVMVAVAFLLPSPPAYAQISVIQADYEEFITSRDGRVRFTEIGTHTFDERGRHRRDWTTRYGESVSEIVLPERNERLTINHQTRTIAVGPSNNRTFGVPDLVQPRVTAADLLAGAIWATSCFFRLVVAELTPGVQTRLGGGRALPIGVREHGPVTLHGHRVASAGSICRQPSTTERWTYAADPGIRTGGRRSPRGRSRSRSAMPLEISLEHTTTVEIDGRAQVVADKRLTAVTRTTAGPDVFSAPAGYATRTAFQ